MPADKYPSIFLRRMPEAIVYLSLAYHERLGLFFFAPLADTLVAASVVCGLMLSLLAGSLAGIYLC